MAVVVEDVVVVVVVVVVVASMVLAAAEVVEVVAEVFVSLIGSSLMVFDAFSVSAVLSVLVVVGGMGKSFGLPPVTTTVMMRAVATKTNPDITTL